MPAEVPLARLQRWMQQVIVHPGPVEEGLLDPTAQAEVPRSALDDVILPSATLSAGERVGVYQGMYLLRMEEALASDYPGLKHFLGHERFFALVRAYVQEHPSRHFSLNRLGDHLPDFIARAGGVPRPAFCADLARLELAITHVFDAPQAEPMGTERIEAVPPEAWEHMRFVAVPAVRLLAFRYPVAGYLDSVKEGDGHEHPPLRRKDSWAVVYRRDDSVFRLPLERVAHALLSDLLAGRPLGQAIAAVLARPGRRPKPDDLFRWFRHWVAAGLFASMERAG